jgi:hypothetical protein
MLLRLGRSILVVCAVFALAGAAHANPIIIFSTGVDGSGIPLPDGTIGDPHYLLTVVPGGTTEIRVRTSVGGYPIPPWIGDDSISAWIGPNNDLQVDGPVGNFEYQTTFSLAGLNPDTAVLSGRWATDDDSVGTILLNGVPTANSATTYNVWYAFSINSGFVAGNNTLDFIVHNNGGPTGLRVEISGTADSVPEPASLVLLAVGLAALTALRRRVV